VVTNLLPAPFNPRGATNNVLVPNPAISVWVVTNSSYPAGRLTVNWYDAPSGGTLLQSGALQYTPTNHLVGSYIYWTETRDTISSLTSLGRTAVTLVLVTNTVCVTTVNYNLVSSNLLDFEDISTITTGAFPIPNPYGGLLLWSNCRAIDGAHFIDNPSGYGAGVVSGANVVLNGFGTPLIITNDVPFGFLSGYFTSAFNDNLKLQVVGYNGSTMLYSNIFVLSPTNSTKLNLNYVNVTRIIFNSFGGTHHNGYNIHDIGTEFALDNAVITTNFNSVSINTDCSGVVGNAGFAANVTNCAATANPGLSALVSSGESVNWYADSAGTNLLARAVNPFVPTNAIPGNYSFYAQTVNTNTFFVSTNLTPVQFVLLDCLGTPPTVSFVGTNIVVSYFGNVRLQSATNLVPPISWVDALVNPYVNFTNLTWPNDGTIPIRFFRLVAP
jgi:hypothetical protein